MYPTTPAIQFLDILSREILIHTYAKENCLRGVPNLLFTIIKIETAISSRMYKLILEYLYGIKLHSS